MLEIHSDRARRHTGVLSGLRYAARIPSRVDNDLTLDDLSLASVFCLTARPQQAGILAKVSIFSKLACVGLRAVRKRLAANPRRKTHDRGPSLTTTQPLGGTRHVSTGALR